MSKRVWVVDIEQYIDISSLNLAYSIVTIGHECATFNFDSL